MTVQTVLTEQRRWVSPFPAWVPVQSDTPEMAAVFGDIPLLSPKTFIIQLSDLELFLLRITLALMSDRWSGADHWERNGDPLLTLDALLAFESSTDAAIEQAVADILAAAADHTGSIRVLVLLGSAEGAAALAGHVEQSLLALSHPAFVSVRPDASVAVLVRGDDDAALVRRLLAGLPVPVRRRVRAGLSVPGPSSAITRAATAARTAAEAARPGGPPQDAVTLAGRTLLSIAETNAALGELAAIYVAPLLAHDAATDTLYVVSTTGAGVQMIAHASRP